VFNLLGPITNPAGVSCQVTGVAVSELTPVIAEVLRLLGSKRALVVHGNDGVDELSISAASAVYDVADGTVREYEVTPESVGLNRAGPNDIVGGNVETNLRLAQAVMGGEGGPARDAVLLNAAAGLLVAGLANDLTAGAELAARTIDSGAVRAKLEHVREVSTALKKQVEAS
jgi:anthranilate phosphoribosyltransferase